MLHYKLRLTALCTEIDQHLLIFISSPGTQSVFSLTPGVSLSPPSLIWSRVWIFFQNTHPSCVILDPITAQLNRVFVMGPMQFPQPESQAV